MDFRDYIRKYRNPNELTEILLQIGNGIKELHSLEYIHRDLKPENIVLDLNPLEVRIIDFDRSKNILSVKKGVDRGTPGYYPSCCRWKDGN